MNYLLQRPLQKKKRLIPQNRNQKKIAQNGHYEVLRARL
jgi:hypothetical protein